MKHIRVDSNIGTCILKSMIVIGIFLCISGLLVGTAQSYSSRNEVIKIGLIPTESGVNDGSFNEMANSGLENAITNFGIDGTVYLPIDSEDYANQLQQCVNDGNTLCIAVGFGFIDSAVAAAQNNHLVNFAIVDVELENYPDNLRGISFDSAEVGYLTGTLAALMSESKVIGGIGGVDISPVSSFLEPYKNGASCVNSLMDVIITYINSFLDEGLASQTAQDQMDAGADVIFAAAGPAGRGVLLTATGAGAWAIGVDSDQWLTFFESGAVEGSEYMLTSAMKQVDVAVFDTIEDQVSGTFTSGTALYDLAADGVGLANFHEADASIPQAVKDQLAQVKQDIIDGKIDVWAPCLPSYIFLPMVVK